MHFSQRNIARALTISLVCLIIVFAAEAATGEPRTIRVGFYNTENYFDTINDPACDDARYCDPKLYNFTEKTQELSAAISLFSPDILALCEVENYSTVLALTESLSELTHRNYGIIHYDSKDSRGIDVAAVYDTTLMTLISSEPIFTDYLWRNFIRAEFCSKLSGENFTLFIAHLPSKLGGSRATENREKALRALDSLALAEESLRAIICGDMNDNPKEGKILYNLALSAQKQGKGSYAYRGSWSMPDQIIITPELKRNLLSDQIIVHHPSLIERKGRYKGYPQKNHPSDHLPIFIDIIL
ncbi:MAG: hypothetical protein R3Y61_00110 [Rikenellaceae bacterium]